MKEITLYREDNGQYSTSEAKQDDVSGVYVQKEHLTDLQKENDELRAKLVNLSESKSCTTCNNAGSYDYDDGLGGVCSSPCHCTNNPYSTYSMINSTQIKSLAEVKANAVIDAINATASSIGGSKCICHVVDLERYANKLKGGD